MSRLYSAKPSGSRRVIVSPGEKNAVVMGERRARERPLAATREPDWNRNAPIKEFSEQFKAAMRARGWLRR
jgi:hypothetical protein